MGYKDKEKQRAANRKAQAKFKSKGITEGITSEGITEKVLPAVNLELCRTCGELLPELESPRKHPGKCFNCVFPRVEVVE